MLVSILASTNIIAQTKSGAYKYAETITASDLKSRLTIIASDEFEGRETGREGQKKAAEYIRGKFKEFGFSPIKQLEQGYYQPFRLHVTHPDTVNLIIGTDSLKFLKDMYYFPSLGDMVLEANELVYLGYGISSEDYDDYAEADISGKVVLVSGGEPKNKKGKSLVNEEKESTRWTSDWNKKINLAEEKGAKALLVIDDNFSSTIVQMARYIKRPSIVVGEKKQENDNIPLIYISSKMANRILQISGEKKGHKGLEKRISKKEKPIRKPINIPIKIEVKKHKENLISENVLGYLEGTTKKEELVVVTAHYDHLGKKGELIYNGADDDGSGTSGLLEIAEAFSIANKEGNGPKRSVLFMAVSGEEKGLLGSEFYTDHPVFPLENTVVNLNIDMVGRIDEHHAPDSNYVYIIGSDKLSSQLHEINENANKEHTQLSFDYTYNDESDPNRFYYRSDHYNFAKNNIPVIFYFTGVHEDYHQPTDTIDKIMFHKTEKIIRLVFHTAWEVANRKERIMVDSNKK